MALVMTLSTALSTTFAMTPATTFRMSVPVKLFVPGAIVAVLLLFGSGALACEKHINGHQNGTDTNVEGSSR